jgi:hypothetical protein
MEIIIILIVIAIIGYLIHQSLPNTKFLKAESLIKMKDFTQASNILNGIIDRHIDAPAKLAECKLNLGLNSNSNIEKLKYFNEVISIRKKINNSKSIAKIVNFETKALYEIAKIQYEEAKGNVDKIEQNIRYIDAANKNDADSDLSTLRKKHFYDLSESYFKNAINIEKTGNLLDAIRLYSIAKDYAERSNNISIKSNSITRNAICLLKKGDIITLEHITEFEKADKNYKNELFYRYTIQLLKNNNYSEAEETITKYLNFKSSEIDKLNKIIHADRINKTVVKINEINSKIEKLYNNALSTDDLKSFYENIDTNTDLIKNVDSQLSEKIDALKPTLFNRLLKQYISSEQYGNAINLIQKYPKFWDNPELLKNLGICCYGYASKGLITEQNFRPIISGWLTSVFSDKVILKSLEDTTWDDNYTFTLYESIGSNFTFHKDIPSNVNYEDVSENNISIGSTQKELLQQFESIIHKEIKDANLTSVVNDFYDREKEAIKRIVEIIENEIIFATPHFAITFGINNNIITELDKDYQKYSNEEALEAGLPYIKNSTSTVVYQYFYASDLIDRAISAIKNEKSATIKKLNTTENKQWLEKFENIKSSVEEKLFNTISHKISEDEENEKLIPIMEECLAFSVKNEKLKHQYSNYVAEFCISKVNNDEIDNLKALSLMKGAYLRSPHNPKICKNFITLIKFNLMDMLNDRTRKTTDIYNILDWVKNNMSQTYKQNSNELIKARRDILQQLKQAGVDISLFDDNPLSSLLSGNSLNSEGLKMKKVLLYLKELGCEHDNSNPIDPLKHIRHRLNFENDNLPF